MVTAVGAGDTFPTFTYGLLIAPRVSFCRNATPMHLQAITSILIRTSEEAPPAAVYGSTSPTTRTTRQ